MAYRVYNNTPVDGAIQWEDMSLQYLGEINSVQDGYTNARYIYWTIQYPNNFVVSNDFPNLGSDDCLVFVNKNGIAITVPTASVVDGDIIMPGSILTNALAANAITADKIAGGAVTANAIAAGAITADSITAGIISAEMMAVDAIGTEHIAAGAVTADKIVAGAITADKLAVASVLANAIAAGAITAIKIEAGAIESNHIKSGAIQTNHLEPAFGEQLVIGTNPAIALVNDAIAAESERAIAVEGELQDFTDSANAFFVFDLDLGEMVIGKTGSPFTSKFSTTKLSFMQSGSEIAYISNNKLYISIAQVMDILTIGNANDGYVDIDTKEGGLRASWRAF